MKEEGEVPVRYKKDLNADWPVWPKPYPFKNLKPFNIGLWKLGICIINSVFSYPEEVRVKGINPKSKPMSNLKRQYGGKARINWRSQHSFTPISTVKRNICMREVKRNLKWSQWDRWKWMVSTLSTKNITSITLNRLLIVWVKSVVHRNTALFICSETVS